MRPDADELDFDQVIAREDADATRKRDERAVRNREFEYALRHDFELMIQLAKASSKAAAKEARKVGAVEQ